MNNVNPSDVVKIVQKYSSYAKTLSKRYYICTNTIDVYNELQQSVGELLEEDVI